MTIGLAGAIEDAIRHRFEKIFQNDDAILAAVTLPKFKLKWVESQSKKDLYKHMLIQKMRSTVANNEVTVVEDSQTQTAQSTRDKKDDFYDFKSNDESTPQCTVE